MRIVRQFRSLPRPVQLLLVNDFTIFVGFYMLYPYLTVYFREDLGFSAWMVGLVLGIRVLSQQGLTVVGGTLADHLGYKPVIMLGLALRATGFTLLGFADAFPTVLGAAILSGLGGAIFSPALRAYLASETAGRRAEVFALNNVFGQAGTLLGPLVGLALLGVSFRLVAVGAGAIFYCLLVLQLLYLPGRSRPESERGGSVLNGWREVLANRPFLLFAAVMFGQFTLVNQLYLGLPLEIERLTGGQAAVSALFIVSSLLTITIQVQVTAYCKQRMRPIIATSTGLLIMGAAFLPVLLSAPLLPVGDGQAGFDLVGIATLAVNLFPVIAAACLLSLGVMVAGPFALEMVPRLGRERLTATYFGAYSMAAGIGATAGNMVTGIAFDKQDVLGLPGLPWLLVCAIGVDCGLLMRSLARRPEYSQTTVLPS